jgi:glycerol-3-phosphate O-acyltransferase/dihydroxyacetone phosphate acyltransferase
MWGGLALPGVILNSPVIILAKIISRKKAKEALAASQVKLAGRDVVATWKVLVSLGFTPILYFFYAGLATYLAHGYRLPQRHQLFMPVYAMVALPTIAYSTLKFSEVGIDIYKSLPPLFVSLMPGNYKVIQKLQETRASIASDLHFIIDELGPKVFDNFDQQKILIKPNASAPPPPSTPGREESIIWKEKKSTAVNATGYLTHPLAWADERLFGWGTGSTPLSKQQRKAKKRQGLVGGDQNGIVNDDSEVEVDAVEGSSDEDEDEEEEGDYEDIFRMLNPARFFAPDDPKSPRSPRHGRSRSGSGVSFSEKRIKSNTDLKSLMQPFSSSASTSGGNSTSITKNPASTATSTSTGEASSRSSLLQRRGTGSRQRTHSLKEEVATTDIKEAATPIQKQDFEQAGKELEEKSAENRGGQPGLAQRPSVQDMKSAETTPSTKPSTPEG